ncbi:MAG TPA: DUF4919 domain-containing protein [Candidatus Binatia bacterium]|nr:DUF4919 domain-containing protein [Candidatus Binatia bacterium]
MTLRTYAYRLAFCIVCFVSPASAAETDIESDYAVLLARAKLDPARTDFARLRIAFTKTPAYEPYGTSPSDYNDVDAAIQAGDWDRARNLIDALLQKNYLRIRSHHLAWIVHRRSGDDERAQHHRAFMDGLFRSIVTSGDGKTAESPYIVINVEEEYDVLGLTGLKMLGQGLQHDNGRDFDVLTVQEREGAEPVKLYFDITLPWKNSPFNNTK